VSLKGLRNRDDASDLESERDALRRQRAEAAAELERLKRALSERVAQVQAREHELAEALTRTERREQKLAALEERHTRFAAARLRLAEAREARTAKPQPGSPVAPQLPPVEPELPPAPDLSAERAELEERARELDKRARELEERASLLAARATELDARDEELVTREAELAARVESTHEPEPEREPVPAAAEELEQIEAKLAELHEAEQAFARTQAELAKRSDALAVREELVAAREAALAAAAASPHGSDLAALEERIRRLEQTGVATLTEAQTFSAGLRALQERGLRTRRLPEEPLH
jgi:chromosome segregation ATPase